MYSFILKLGLNSKIHFAVTVLKGYADFCSIPKPTVYHSQSLLRRDQSARRRWETRPDFSLSLKLFLLIIKTTFLLLFMCTNKHRAMNILRGQTVWKYASLSAYLNNYGIHPPILFYDNRLSGNGNKHSCLPTWSDSVSYDPVLSEPDPSERQTGRQTDW